MKDQRFYGPVVLIAAYPLECAWLLPLLPLKVGRVKDLAQSCYVSTGQTCKNAAEKGYKLIQTSVRNRQINMAQSHVIGLFGCFVCHAWVTLVIGIKQLEKKNSDGPNKNQDLPVI